MKLRSGLQTPERSGLPLASRGVFPFQAVVGFLLSAEPAGRVGSERSWAEAKDRVARTAESDNRAFVMTETILFHSWAGGAGRPGRAARKNEAKAAASNL